MNMPQNDSNNIAGRTISSSLYSLVSASVTLSLGFIRFVLLLLFLLPEDFGVFTQAMLFVALAAQLRLPGLDLAVIQRPNLNEPVRRTYLTLKMGFLIASVLLMGLATPFISQAYPAMPLLAGILIALLGIELLKGLNGIQEAFLRRNLGFRQIAVADITSSVAMTIIVPYLAWRGFGAWSLVVEAFVGQVARGAIVWVFARAWWPKVGWNREIAKELWQFSSKLWGNSVLNFVTVRFDDFWIGQALGSQSLGYYSRAYEAANYPRRIIATPLVTVFYSTYARLQGDRQRLSQAFFRLSSLMVRASFGVSLLLVLLAPELVSFLDETWLPMLATFQLMVVYTLLDPLAVGAADLLIAIGRPDLPFRTRILQIVIFIPAVFWLGGWLGIEGVALAANLMVGTGAFILFTLTRRFVDYSARRLWLWPTVASLVTGGVILWLNSVWVSLPSWLALLCKAALICFLYGGLLFLVEKDDLLRNFQTVWQRLRPLLATYRTKSKR